MTTKLTYLHGFSSTKLDIFLFYLKRQCSDAEYWGFFVHVSLSTGVQNQVFTPGNLSLFSYR